MHLLQQKSQSWIAAKRTNETRKLYDDESLVSKEQLSSEEHNKIKAATWASAQNSIEPQGANLTYNLSPSLSHTYLMLPNKHITEHTRETKGITGHMTRNCQVCNLHFQLLT